MHDGGGVGQRDGRGDGSRVVREVRTGRRARCAVARRVVRGGGCGLLGEREQQAHCVSGERAGGLRDEEGAGDAAALRVGVVVGRRRAHPPAALLRAGALQRSVRRRAALGDAEDDDDEGLLGVAECEVAAVGGRGGPAALA